MDLMIVTPEPGMRSEVGRRLLALASDPREVQWVTWPLPGGFQVPLELFLEFEKTGNEPTKQADEPPTTVIVANAEEAPKRRGRPAKIKPDEGAEDKEE